MNRGLSAILTQAVLRPPPHAKVPHRPMLVRLGKRFRRHLDAILARYSTVPNSPLLAASHFTWTRLLRDHWRDICEEALAVTQDIDRVPALNAISPDHKRIAADANWRSFFLIGYGERIEHNLDRCPKTAALLARIPKLNSGFFSILRPGAHIPAHRGVSKALITCHLALQVPEDGDLRMRVGDLDVGWREGETLVFDDTYEHEVWNDTTGTRMVLLIQFERPLRQPGRAIAALFLGGIRRSAFVRDARDNIAKWEEALAQLEAEPG